MTVHNINRLFTKEQLNTFKQYLEAEKITVAYSEWLNQFGVRTYKKVRTAKDDIRAKVIQQYLWNKLKDTSVSKLIACPQIYPDIEKKYKRSKGD